MKAEELRQQERLLRTWKTMLGELDRMGPSSGVDADLQAFRRVRRYIVGQIETTEGILHKALRRSHSLGLQLNSLPPGDNPSDNRPTSGGENA